MSRLGAVVALSSVVLACGAEGPSHTEEPVESVPETGETDAPLDPEALEFALMGRATPMTARAELKVVEGEQTVHVAISGRSSGTDFVMIDLTFDGIEAALGPHRVEFSLPNDGEHFVNSSLDDNWYYSQGGEIEVTVGGDGSIEGNFAIDLARGELPAMGEAAVFAPSDVAIPLEGRFRGAWVLNCHSRLMGHMTLVAGGDYCEGLVIPE